MHAQSEMCFWNAICLFHLYEMTVEILHGACMLNMKTLHDPALDVTCMHVCPQ